MYIDLLKALKSLEIREDAKYCLSVSPNSTDLVFVFFFRVTSTVNIARSMNSGNILKHADKGSSQMVNSFLQIQFSPRYPQGRLVAGSQGYQNARMLMYLM